MKRVDDIKKPVKPIRLVPLLAELPARAVRRVRHGLRFLMASKIVAAGLLIVMVIPLAAFEAHVVNVTAKIERQPCIEFEIQSKTFWKTHPELWVLPQTLGSVNVTTSDEANEVFLRSADSPWTKLKAQLLALKFNIAFYGSGSALVPGNTITLQELANQADAFLIGDPGEVDDAGAEALAEYIRSVNLSGFVSTCPTCPDSTTVVTGNNFEISNGSTTANVATLPGNVNEGNQVTANFTLAKECEDKQFSLVAYKSPTFVFQSWRANEDVVYDSVTGFFGPGPNSLTVDVPACHFYIAFVLGPVIETMGPEGSDNFYSAQGRLVSDDAGDEEGVNCEDYLPKEEPFEEQGDAQGFVLESFSLEAPEESGDASSTANSTPETGDPEPEEGQIPGGGGGPSTSSGQVADELPSELEETPTSTEPNASSTEPQDDPNTSSTQETPPSTEEDPPAEEPTPSEPEPQDAEDPVEEVVPPEETPPPPPPPPPSEPPTEPS